MLIHRVFRFFAILGLLAMAGYTQAEPLTDAQVRNFIDTMEEMRALAEQHDDVLLSELENESGGMPDQDWSRVFSSSLERAKGTGIYSDIEDIARANGFDNAEAYGRVGDKVFHAMMASEMGGKATEMQAEMAKAMEEIERNPNMSATQKKQMQDMMRGSMGMMESVTDAPEADIRTLRPHMNELRSVMENDDQGQ